MQSCNFTLKKDRTVSKKDECFTVFMEPSLKPGCTRTVFINGTPVSEAHESVGDFEVVGLPHGGVTVKALTDNPRGVVSFSVKCEGERACGPTLRGTLIGNATEANVPEESFIDDATKKFIEQLTRIKEFLGEAIDKLAPEELKAIKKLIGDGLHAITNIIPKFFLPVPNPLALLGGLSVILDKIGINLQRRDPVDGSREAIKADAEALQVLIEEEIIPFVRLVGQAAKLDHETERRRYALISKLLDINVRDLNHIERQTKRSGTRKRGGRKA